jgi:Mrp family chromosome partitioning ATPase
MGKISNALERYKKEKSIKAERLPIAEPENLTKKGPRSTLARELIIQNGFSPKLVVLSAPESLEAENFKTLKAQILFPKNGKSPQTIMVTSAFPAEGKTFVSANLAVSLARLHEYLLGRGKLPDLLVRTKIEKLSLLTAGSSASNPTELVSSNRMKKFLEEVKGRYQDRFIIIDATPCNVTAEASVLAKYVEGIIFVVMAKKTSRETIQRNVETLGKRKIIGIVFNGYNKAFKNYRKYYNKYYKKK